MQFRDGGYSGEKEAYRDLAGLRLIESRYARQITMGEHFHRFPLIHIVLRGTVREASALPSDEFGVAEAVFHPAGSPHATTWREGGAGFAVEFGEGVDREISARLPSQPFALPIGFTSGLMLSLRREAYRADDCAPLAAQCYAAEILTEAERRPTGAQETQTPQWLRQARDMVCDAGAAPLSLTQIAASVQVHPVHLSRSFRQHFGETLGDCLRRRRITLACQRIVRQENTLTEIAQETGFADHAHFTRTFRHFIGMAPSEYAALLTNPRKSRPDPKTRESP